MMINRYVFFLLLINHFSYFSYGQDLAADIVFSEHQYLPFYGFKKKKNTSLFQGNKEKKNYFEGWYFKMVSKSGESVLSVIPGISLSQEGQAQHAFIQIINGRTAKTHYFKFPVTEFSFSKKDFAIKIGDNYFSKQYLSLDIQDSAHIITGSVKMSELTPYRIKKRQPAIMGWYRFVPFMECYHGVVSLTHHLTGSIAINNTYFDFDQGKGYLEKDWGSSMPKAWIWIQSNHFTDHNTSFMLSVASIPWLGKSFTGFLGFYYQNGIIHRFATYTHSKIEIEKSKKNHLSIRIMNRKNTFVIEAINSNSGLLKAPVNGAMDRRIAESIDAYLKISMVDSKNTVIYSDSSRISGLEMVGDIDLLIGGLE